MKELELMEKCNSVLENGKPLFSASFTEDEIKNIRHYRFLSLKPMIIVINSGEDGISDTTIIDKLNTEFDKDHFSSLVLSAEIENEIASLPEDDQEEFFRDMGIAEPGIERIIRTAYSLLGLSSFFTVGEDEVRAWTIKKKLPAQKAAGVIHTDFEKGFIRAETISYSDFIANPDNKILRESGKYRLEGKEYPVADGDIINFRFNL